MSRRTPRPGPRRQITSPAVLLAVVALALGLTLGSVGTAAAGGLTKTAVKRIAGKVVTKRASGLTVARAASAGTADSAGVAAVANGVAPSSVTGAGIADGTLTSGDLGIYRATVDYTGSIASSSPGVTSRRLSAGHYVVTMPRAVTSCTTVATLRTINTSTYVTAVPLTPTEVYVDTFNNTDYFDTGFSMIVAC